MAHSPAWADPDRYVRRWVGAKRRRSKSGNTAGRRGLVPGEGKALAWRHADHGHDPYRHSGTARRQSRRVDGEGQRRTILQVTRNTHDAVKEEFDMNLSFQNKVALV